MNHSHFRLDSISKFPNLPLPIHHGWRQLQLSTLFITDWKVVKKTTNTNCYGLNWCTCFKSGRSHQITKNCWHSLKMRMCLMRTKTQSDSLHKWQIHRCHRRDRAKLWQRTKRRLSIYWIHLEIGEFDELIQTIDRFIMRLYPFSARCMTFKWLLIVHWVESV